MTDTPQWIKDAAKKIYGEDFDNWQQVAVAIARHAPKPSASVQERAAGVVKDLMSYGYFSGEYSGNGDSQLESVTQRGAADRIAAAFADFHDPKKVQELVNKWREMAAGKRQKAKSDPVWGTHEVAHAEGIEECADELESALRNLGSK